MLIFTLETEDADWWIEVWGRDSRWLGNISRDMLDDWRLKFMSSSKDCWFEAEELVAIADKIKEMRNANFHPKAN
jgi:hypothetical protein